MRGAGLPIAGSLQGASVSICTNIHTNIFAGPLQGASLIICKDIFAGSLQGASP